MENLLSALAFAGLIAAQFLSVVLVNTQRCEDPSPQSYSESLRVWLPCSFCSQSLFFGPGMSLRSIGWTAAKSAARAFPTR